MKQDTLQQLLAKYQEGTIDAEELEQLNRLTHRDEVMAAAVGRARTIVRRRTMRTVGLVVTAAALLGAGASLLVPKASGDEVLMASAPEDIIATIEEPAPATVVESAAPDAVPSARPSTPHPTMQQQTLVADADQGESSSDPVVVCNNQCDADSVISDIWKFLSA